MIELKTPKLTIKNLTHCHERGKCKEDCFHLGTINLEVKQGEIIAIVGPSGSGKTTLLRLIAGLEPSMSGRMLIDQRLMFDEAHFVPPERRHVGMVFQEHALFPHLTVKKNILFGIKHLSAQEQKSRLEELEVLLGLHDYVHRYPHELSGGQQQRVALARTLAQKPSVILLDEPLSNIDADLRTSLSQELKEVLNKTRSTALWVTHDQSEALDLADRIIVMNQGHIEQIDTPWNLYNNPKTRFVADFIGHAVFIRGELKGKVITTEIGQVECPPCLNHLRHMEVMVRPDDVKVTVNKDGQAKVCKRQFLGAIQLYSICLSSGQSILTYQPPQINWPLETRLDVTLKPKSVVAFPVE